MTDSEFIEKYCVIKYNNKITNIHLKDYQKKFLQYLKRLRNG